MTLRNYVASIAVIALIVACVSAVQIVFAGINSTQPTPTARYQTFDFFASSTNAAITATSTIATSTNIIAWTDSSGTIFNGSFNIAGAKKVSVFLTRGGTFGVGTQGTTTYAIQGTHDGTNWFYVNKLIVSTSSAASTVSNTPEVGPLVIQGSGFGNSATSTLIYSLDLTENWKAIRCIAAVRVDGASSCTAAALW